MRRIARVSALLVVFAVAFAAAWVRLPYYAVGPGPANDVAPLIDVQGVRRYASEGQMIMTTVHIQQVTALDSLLAWIDQTRYIVEEEALYQPGVDREEEEQRAISQMDQSKIHASIVVLSEVFDYPQDHGEGALIQAVFDGCPAEGKLFVGDLVSSIDEQPIASDVDARRAIDAVPPGEQLVFRVRAGGEVHEVELRRDRCIEGEQPVVGIGMVDAFPFGIEIASGDVGGPSAGLMFALGLYDAVTPGDLTAGRTIAGTGTISPDGEVGGIGGIVDKVVGAERAGATVFLVPAENMAEVRDLDVGEMRLIRVGTFDEAVESLRAT